MGRGKPRWRAPAPAAPVPLLPRCDEPALELDPARRLEAVTLRAALEAHGIAPEPWHFALEEHLGGVSFGRSYQQVSLGFRAFFRRWLEGKGAVELPRTEQGARLLRFGYEGDTLYFVAAGGECWAQDGIADRWPHFEAADLYALARRLRWPPSVCSPPA